ncbi:hypothetical protein BX661DRAFT_223752 [Kickxella alabastrina]|uniref:uncharacterized protein n=1 Tax=Kickxella alabastrina TaxID=61397 RepID=UPI0022201F23|nr:uncharacterized protein BX661DRAFT_223752 [Kickxella alabastrina]KAI7830975.1 hypothetical protein BX661DRAFT_223752 [Kickxella alabastrina]
MKVWLRRIRSLSVVYTVVLVAANLYFYNYAKILSVFHPRFLENVASDIRFNLYGDPQIEGDAKLQRQPWVGRLDLLINDYYLHHVYKSTISAFRPRYAVTMGDIFSSQWVSRAEYYTRIHRFKWISNQIDARNNTIDGGDHRHFYLAGNHDIGMVRRPGIPHQPLHQQLWPAKSEWLVDIDGTVTMINMTTNATVVVLNAMNLDATRVEKYRHEVWDFPTIILDDGFVAYQDYLSPVTSAYLLHCLKPTIVFNGHDHNGCLATHVGPNIDRGFCSLTLDELDAYSSKIEDFAQSTISTTGSSNMTGASAWTAIEITVRSAMGAYNGVTGIFDIQRFADSQLQQNRGDAHHRELRIVNEREMVGTANGYEYRYRELLVVPHSGF